MKVKSIVTYDAVQFKSEKYNEFKDYVTQTHSLRVNRNINNPNQCWILATLEPNNINDGDYVIFNDNLIVEVLDEIEFELKYREYINQSEASSEIFDSIDLINSQLRDGYIDITIGAENEEAKKQLGIITDALRLFREFYNI